MHASTGIWMLGLPRSFYDGVLGVSALPPFNEHLMQWVRSGTHRVSA